MFLFAFKVFAMVLHPSAFAGLCLPGLEPDVGDEDFASESGSKDLKQNRGPSAAFHHVAETETSSLRVYLLWIVPQFIQTRLHITFHGFVTRGSHICGIELVCIPVRRPSGEKAAIKDESRFSKAGNCGGKGHGF